ncbi:MAG: MGMT family protein [Candidatus Binatia bacterium]
MSARPPSDSFYREVRRMVRRIPRGKVVTYGQLAAILGRPRAARAVGSALRRLSGPLAREVPWHRVLNAAGRVSFRDDSWPELQREILEREGVRFRRGAVDLKRARWTGPETVPGTVSVNTRGGRRSGGGARRRRRT